jgi:hypothetical protein
MLQKTISASIALVLALVYLMPACTALGTGIMAIEEKNISLNLSSEYNISKNMSVAMTAQTININSTTPEGKNASLTLMSISMEGDDSTQMNMNPEEFSNFMETMLIGAIKLMGAKEIAQQTVVSPLDKNVTMHTFLMPGTNKKPGKNSSMAFWDLDKYMHVIMTSDLDQNESARIIETLEMTP